jgi:apolipoprotein N-acyltransferase
VFVQAVGEPIEVAVIQNNISLKDKWQSGQAHVIATRYFEASRPLSGVDLIVWPEGALPAYLDQISAGFLNALHQHPSDFLIGLLERSDRVAGSDYYNAALGIGEQTSLYRKHQLVPFGEYLPLAPLLGWLLDYLNIPMSDFSAGPGQQAPLPLAGQQIGVSICYEDAFSTRINTALPDATVLANLSEDAWFGDSLAPHQRLQMARARALETGRPMIRSSNNGLSSLIGPDGVVNALAPQFETAIVRGTVQPMTGLTPAVRYGNLPVGLACLFLLGIGLWRRKAASGHA